MNLTLCRWTGGPNETRAIDPVRIANISALGLLSSAVYNLVIRWTGGLLFEFDAVAGPDAL